MSDNLKQDAINAIGQNKFIQHCKKIEKMYDDADSGICSNNSIEQIINPNDKRLLKLYNVQVYIDKYSMLINKFIFAWDEFDAINIIKNNYHNFKFNENEIYCQKVDIKHGMTFKGV